VSWIGLGAAAALQLMAGIVRARAWFHVIRQSWPEATDLRYRDVVVAHLGGVGWNAILPAHTGDAVKVAIVNRRMPERRLALLGSTLVPPGVVEAVFTAILLVGLVVTSPVSLQALNPSWPLAGTALAAGGVVSVLLVAAALCRHRLREFARSVRRGLAVLGRPRVVLTNVVPWLLAGRGVRLLAFACVLPAAGLPVALGPAVALMALQGATPSAGAAATAARIALLSAVLAGTGTGEASAQEVAAALTATYGLTSTVNVLVSGAAVAWLLRTTSPHRIIGFVGSAFRTGTRVEPDAATVEALAPTRVQSQPSRA
jgi:hypothetical protein